MQHPLYPKVVDDNCPYCGSENTTNDMDETYPTAEGVSVKVDCRDCNKSHHLNYQLATITLDTGDGGQDYVAPQICPDMHKEGENDQGKTLVGVVQGSDGIFIMAHGYGDYSSTDGYGCPVIIEMANDQLRICPWPDINEEDCGPDVIELGAAKISNRVDDDLAEYPFALQVLTPGGSCIESVHYETFPKALKGIEKTSVPFGHKVKIRARCDLTLYNDLRKKGEILHEETKTIEDE